MTNCIKSELEPHKILIIGKGEYKVKPNGMLCCGHTGPYSRN